LADVLARLGRDFDLFALLSGRLEDANDATRAELAVRQRAVLERLIEQARQNQRADEERLYASALARLTAPRG
jgi:hypothetical protein